MKRKGYHAAYYRANRSRMIQQSEAWSKKHPTYARERGWRAQGLDLTWDAFLLLVAKVDGRCEICGKVQGQKLQPDHDHQTGALRGLLCTRCNTMLGYAGDSPEVLRGGAEYLLRKPTAIFNGGDL